jgi:hypothetical protein
MKQLYYICAQPAIIYYEWHLEVMIHNFRKQGIRDDQMHIVLGLTDMYSPSVRDRLQQKYPTILFELYEDTRELRSYLPSIQPHLLKKHFTKHAYLQDSVIFYHDCDVLFTRPVSWEKLLSDDVWYFSDTISYIGSLYIKSKKFNILQEMCDIVGVSPVHVEAEEANSGGGQHIMKNVTSKYWSKVEEDSHKLSQYFEKKSKEYNAETNYHPIQAWTAGMWSLLWNGWYFGHDIKVVKEMDFCWATDPISRWDEYSIYHNAGVTETTDKMFYKAQYTKTYPVGLRLEDFRDDRCSYNYTKEILETLG